MLRRFNTDNQNDYMRVLLPTKSLANSYKWRAHQKCQPNQTLFSDHVKLACFFRFCRISVIVFVCLQIVRSASERATSSCCVRSINSACILPSRECLASTAPHYHGVIFIHCTFCFIIINSATEFACKYGHGGRRFTGIDFLRVVLS